MLAGSENLYKIRARKKYFTRVMYHNLLLSADKSESASANEKESHASA